MRTNIHKNVECLCEIIGIKLQGPPVKYEIVDEYFDDSSSSLWTSGNSTCRVRSREGSKPKVTLKREDANETREVLSRIEHEFDRDADPNLNDMRSNSAKKSIESIVRDKLGIEINFSGLLNSVLTVRNCRLKQILVTDKGAYDFCYDRYYYFDPRSGLYSRVYSEIEIEINDENFFEDEQVTKLRSALERIMSYTPIKISKFQQGRNWLFDKNIDVDIMNFIAIDIVRYSSRPTELQQQMIQKLNRAIKLALTNKIGEDYQKFADIVGTGDGAIIGLRNHDAVIVDIVAAIQKNLREEIIDWEEDKKFSFRTGINHGPVFRYVDLSGRFNMAGDGINMACRAMGLATDWGIFATGQLYQIQKSYGRSKKYFHHIGRKSIKHDIEIDVYNVYKASSQEEGGDGFGNPSGND